MSLYDLISRSISYSIWDLISANSSWALCECRSFRMLMNSRRAWSILPTRMSWRGELGMNVHKPTCVCIVSMYVNWSLSSGLTYEHDNAPRNLDAQRESPLYWPVWCIATGETDPIRHHRSEADTTAWDSSDETAVMRRRDLAKVDWDGSDHSLC